MNYDEPVINHVLLSFKLPVHNSRETHCLNVRHLLNDLKVTKKKKYRLSSNSEKKRKAYQNKWRLNNEKLPLERKP